jgi:predicted negative regulator of RcsB-dependent stress response
VDPAFYRPLRRLDKDWRVIAGVVSPEGAQDSIRSLAMFEAAAGRTAYAVATACGLGRCTVEDAELAAAATVATADAAEVAVD